MNDEHEEVNSDSAPEQIKADRDAAYLVIKQQAEAWHRRSEDIQKLEKQIRDLTKENAEMKLWLLNATRRFVKEEDDA